MDGAILSLGSTGAMVTALQQNLSDLGYWTGGIDGEFGTLTQGALLQFQAENSLDTDGVAGSDVFEALKRARPRSLPRERTDATAADLKNDGSRIIQHADNTKFAGLLSMILGVLGVGNSIAVNSSGGPTANGNTEIAQTLSHAIDLIKANATNPAKPPPGAQLTDITTTLQNLLNNVNGGAIHPTQPINTVFDFLTSNPQISGALHTGLESLAGVVGSIVPGLGGSLLAFGLGLAARHFGSQISQARTDDHNTGVNIANLPKRNQKRPK